MTIHKLLKRIARIKEEYKKVTFMGCYTSKVSEGGNSPFVAKASSTSVTPVTNYRKGKHQTKEIILLAYKPCIYGLQFHI